MTKHWECQNAGWYTSHLGGIALERDHKWYFYPIDDTPPHGPFNTLRAAKAHALPSKKQETP